MDDTAPYISTCSSGDRAFGSGPKGRRFDSCRVRNEKSPRNQGFLGFFYLLKYVIWGVNPVLFFLFSCFHCHYIQSITDFIAGFVWEFIFCSPDKLQGIFFRVSFLDKVADISFRRGGFFIMMAGSFAHGSVAVSHFYAFKANQ